MVSFASILTIILFINGKDIFSLFPLKWSRSVNMITSPFLINDNFKVIFLFSFNVLHSAWEIIITAIILNLKSFRSVHKYQIMNNFCVLNFSTQNFITVFSIGNVQDAGKLDHPRVFKKTKYHSLIKDTLNPHLHEMSYPSPARECFRTHR